LCVAVTSNLNGSKRKTIEKYVKKDPAIIRKKKGWPSIIVAGSTGRKDEEEVEGAESWGLVTGGPPRTFPG